MKIERHADFFRVVYSFDTPDEFSVRRTRDLSLFFMILNSVIYAAIGFFLACQYFEILILIAFITKSKIETTITGIRFEACSWFMKYEKN